MARGAWNVSGVGPGPGPPRSAGSTTCCVARGVCDAVQVDAGGGAETSPTGGAGHEPLVAAPPFEGGAANDFSLMRCMATCCAVLVGRATASCVLDGFAAGMPGHQGEV